MAGEGGSVLASASHCLRDVRDAGESARVIFDYRQAVAPGGAFVSRRFVTLDPAAIALRLEGRVDLGLVPLGDLPEGVVPLPPFRGDAAELASADLFTMGHPLGLPMLGMIGVRTRPEQVGDHVILMRVSNFDQSSGSAVVTYDGRLAGVLSDQLEARDFVMPDDPGGAKACAGLATVPASAGAPAVAARVP